jgi:hypothetical protein
MLCDQSYYNLKKQHVRFERFTAVTMKNAVLFKETADSKGDDGFTGTGATHEPAAADNDVARLDSSVNKLLPSNW